MYNIIIFNNKIYFADYVKSLKTIFNIIAVYNAKEKNKIKKIINESGDNIIFLFLQTIPINIINKVKDRCFLLNTEQLSKNRWYRDIIKYINQDIKILDYSLGNIQLVKNRIKKDIYYNYLPYQPNKNEIYNYPKNHDVAFIGSLSPRRKKILNLLGESEVDVNRIIGWENKRDKKLFHYKILLNIHHTNNYNIFEEFRCNRAILNKIIVISEKSAFNEEHPLKEFMIECDYKDIPRVTINTLKNYEEIYKKLFKNFNLEIIIKKYKDLTNLFEF